MDIPPTGKRILMSPGLRLYGRISTLSATLLLVFFKPDPLQAVGLQNGVVVPALYRVVDAKHVFRRVVLLPNGVDAPVQVAGEILCIQISP